MELEGLGVSFVGKSVWVYTGSTHKRNGSCIPWEYIQGVNYGLRILVRGEHAVISQIESDWNCVWSPSATKDWSCIATLLRGITGPGLLVIDQISAETIPSSFWSFLDTLVREGRSVTRVWIHTEAPSWVPDAVFFPPVQSHDVTDVFQICKSMPARGGHGPLNFHGSQREWESLMTATREQGLGIVLSDLEESAWTLFWHRPADSRPTSEHILFRGVKWVEAGTALLKGHFMVSSE